VSFPRNQHEASSNTKQLCLVQLAWLSLRPWRWRHNFLRNFGQKCVGLHGIKSQKMNSRKRNSNPKYTLPVAYTSVHYFYINTDIVASRAVTRQRLPNKQL
jgi:hypothetical protein